MRNTFHPNTPYTKEGGYPMTMWYENEKNHYRLHKIETIIMKRKFPQFALYKSKEKKEYVRIDDIYWGGKLTTNFGNTYSVAIVYPQNFPYGEIRAFIPQLFKTPTPHKYTDGHLCLYSNDHGGGGEGIGRETTAATIVGWTAAWLNAWEVYKRTQKWPGR